MPEIILNEKQWAEDAIENSYMGQKPYDTLNRIARYYHDAGFKRGSISKLVESHVLRCDPSANIVKWQGMIDASVRASDKYPLVDIPFIGVTEREMRTIDAISGILLRRLMFTLLCLAKYGNALSEKNNGWVNRDTREIFSLANITATIKRQALMVNDLWNAGYIKYSNIVDNTNLRVAILDDESPVCIRITDFRNIGNQYMMHSGAQYFECEGCGLVIKRTSNRQKYCSCCAADVHSKMTVSGRQMNIA